jgi:hypothetical protein
MKPVDRQKICPNCDGRVSYDATQCMYCFTTLQVENSVSKLFNAPSDNLSIYTPPYSAKHSEASESKTAVPKSASPYSPQEAVTALDKGEAEANPGFLPILFLTIAGNLLTIGLLQFFFSDHGTVRLEINGSYWFLMVLASLPLFYLGWKKLVQD